MISIDSEYRYCCVVEKYARISSASCESHGMMSLKSNVECNDAASVLGLSDIVADNTGWDGPPHGCILGLYSYDSQYPYRLMMNSPHGMPHETLPCGSKYRFMAGTYTFYCLCVRGKN